MKMTPQEALHKANAREWDADHDLQMAAIDFAAGRVKGEDFSVLHKALQDAAKKWTNAYHQASRCRKHVRDAGGEA